MIYHITTISDWHNALEQGSYTAGSLEKEGFLHSSYDHQLRGVVERYYKGSTDLILLHIDESKVTSEIKYELSPSVNEVFPHIYGPLNLDAVVDVSNV